MGGLRGFQGPPRGLPGASQGTSQGRHLPPTHLKCVGAAGVLGHLCGGTRTGRTMLLWPYLPEPFLFGFTFHCILLILKQISTRAVSGARNGLICFEFLLLCGRPRKGRFSMETGRFWPICPFGARNGQICFEFLLLCCKPRKGVFKRKRSASGPSALSRARNGQICIDRSGKTFG